MKIKWLVCKMMPGMLLLTRVAIAGEAVSAGDVLGQYKQALAATARASMRIQVSRTIESDANGPRYDMETDLKLCQDGNDFDYFGTTTPFDGRGDPGRRRLESRIVRGSQFYTTVTWREGDKPKLAQIAPVVEWEKLICATRNAAEYGGMLFARVDGCVCNSIPELLGDSADLRLAETFETVAGERCHVLSGTTKYGKVTAWISPERGYNAVKWLVEKGPNDFYDDYRIAEAGIVNSSRAFEVLEFDSVDDIFAAAKGRATYKHTDSEGKEVIVTYECTVSEIDLDPDFGALGAFKFKIPDGTPVLITAYPGVRYIWQSGQAVADVNGLTFDEIDRALEQQ